MGSKKTKNNFDYDLTCYNDTVEERKQTLYTNISLRDLSGSPDRGDHRKSKKILISNNPRNNSQDSHENLPGHRGENGAILNIKTVQDINIYNNSFIVNTGG